jgi:hypothetical protein
LSYEPEVDLGGVEPPLSPLRAGRFRQLSYRPNKLYYKLKIENCKLKIILNNLGGFGQHRFGEFQSEDEYQLTFQLSPFFQLPDL